MYTQFFHLKQPPFSIAPDPRYLFMSERHREALAHLLFGLNSGGGFVLLTGEIGAGKTTVCRLFLEQIPPRCNVAYIFNPKQTVLELLRSICDEFGIDTVGVGEGNPTVKNFIDPLNTYLLKTHSVQQTNVLIIDEAQNLSADVLEQLRLLTNLETSERKLLQIVLIGQPELRVMLAKPELEQLAQRVIARFHLGALSLPETVEYIGHRLRVAGNLGPVLFSRRAMHRVHQSCRGIPRRINLVCDRALLSAYASGKRGVDAATVALAAREVFDLDSSIISVAAPLPRWRALAAAIVLGVLVAGGSMLALQPRSANLLRSPVSTAESPVVASNAVARSPDLTVASVRAPLSVPSLPSPASLSVPQTTSALAPIPTSPTAQLDISPVLGNEARDMNNAYRRLGLLWKLTLTDESPCTTAQQADVFCFRSSKGLTEIRQLDRPGILTLYDNNNQKYYVLMLGIGNEQALLQIGEQLQTVSLNALAHRWHGEFATLWRGPPGTPRGIAKNAQGAPVDWLISHLAHATGKPNTHAAKGERVFDANHAMQLREFQLTQGLLPDGVAGPQTLMRLVSVTEPAEPHLKNLSVATTPLVKK